MSTLKARSLAVILGMAIITSYVINGMNIRATPIIISTRSLMPYSVENNSLILSRINALFKLSSMRSTPRGAVMASMITVMNRTLAR